jgi:hypothetical protein
MNRRPTSIRAPQAFRAALASFAILILTSLAATTWAVEIQGVQPIAFDQPQIEMMLQPAAGGNPYLDDEGFGIKLFNITAFLDTGSSGIVIDPRTADPLGVPRTPGVTFEDVAIGGGTKFAVSQPVNVRVAGDGNTDVGNLATFSTVYNQAYNSLRLQIGPTNLSPDPFSEALDIAGMPVMMGKTVVMDPKPLNSLVEPMKTYIYNPGTPFNPAHADSNPGIPTTSHHVALSYGNFDRFTTTTPDGASPPAQNHNPFIGPNPVRAFEVNPPVDNTPPVTIGYGGQQTAGSFLLDSGAVASFNSTKLAGDLHVRYVDGTFGTPQPRLEVFNPLAPGVPGVEIVNQFLLPVQGIGGTVTVAGFFLDSLLLHTQEGGANSADPNQIKYAGAPVFVNDVELTDALTHTTLTLDGIFGMNFLVASAFLEPDLNIGETAAGPYSWVTFDEPNGLLGLDLGIVVPEPGSIVLAGVGAIALAVYGWRRRRVAG